MISTHMQRVGTWLLRNSRISNHHENIFQKLSPWFYDLLDELWYPLSWWGMYHSSKDVIWLLKFQHKCWIHCQKKILLFCFSTRILCLVYVFLVVHRNSNETLLRHPLSSMVKNDFLLTNNHTDLIICILWYKQFWRIFIQCEHQNIFLNYW